MGLDDGPFYTAWWWKMFLVLGIRKTSIPIGRALCVKDITVLHMSFMKKSTGEIINQILEDLSKV